MDVIIISIYLYLMIFFDWVIINFLIVIFRIFFSSLVCWVVMIWWVKFCSLLFDKDGIGLVFFIVGRFLILMIIIFEIGFVVVGGGILCEFIFIMRGLRRLVL